MTEYNDQINQPNMLISSQYAQLNKSPIRVVSSPRKFNFSQINKLIKLIHKDLVYSIPQQKPNDQFGKKMLKSTKTPIFLRFEIFPICMTNMHET